MLVTHVKMRTRCFPCHPSIIPKVSAPVYFHDQRQAHKLPPQLELFHCPNTTFRSPLSTKKISFINQTTPNVRHFVHQPPPRPSSPHLRVVFIIVSVTNPPSDREENKDLLPPASSQTPSLSKTLISFHGTLNLFPARACKYVLTSCNRSLYLMLAKPLFRQSRSLQESRPCLWVNT